MNRPFEKVYVRAALRADDHTAPLRLRAVSAARKHDCARLRGGKYADPRADSRNGGVVRGNGGKPVAGTNADAHADAHAFSSGEAAYLMNCGAGIALVSGGTERALSFFDLTLAHCAEDGEKVCVPEKGYVLCTCRPARTPERVKVNGEDLVRIP
ncbi:MAG: hypothetical protein IJU52_01895 [Clostridia bacterium]|nr:hypothetical protein [Clostridia bacterium]